MTGEEIKRIIRESGYNLAYISRELGISPQNLNSKLRTKTVKLDFYKSIVDIINKEKPQLVPNHQAIAAGNKAVAAINSTIENASDARKEIESLKQRISDLEQIIYEKERLISVLMKEKK